MLLLNQTLKSLRGWTCNCSFLFISVFYMIPRDHRFFKDETLDFNKLLLLFPYTIQEQSYRKKWLSAMMYMSKIYHFLWELPSFLLLSIVPHLISHWKYERTIEYVPIYAYLIFFLLRIIDHHNIDQFQ